MKRKFWARVRSWFKHRRRVRPVPERKTCSVCCREVAHTVAGKPYRSHHCTPVLFEK